MRPTFRCSLLSLLVAASASAQLTTFGPRILDPCFFSPGVCDTDDGFGRVLATGDFDDDGFDDLAVGIPDDSVGGDEHAGAVQVFYGTVTGLTTAGNQLWTQASSGVDGTPEALDAFGQSLAVGDFDDDGFDDLAIGAPGEGVGIDIHVGAVWVLFGGSSGLSSAGSISWDQDDSFPTEDAESNDEFGYALAACDADDDGTDDLIVSAPFEDMLFGPTNAGTIHLFTSSASGVLDVETILPASGQAVAEEQIGMALSCGPRHGGETPLVAAGAMYHDVGGQIEAGGVDEYLTIESPFQVHSIDQDDTDIPGGAETADNFGFALVHGDFDDNGGDDLVISILREDLSGVNDAGAIVVQSAYDSPFASLFFDQTAGGGALGTGDNFGRALAVGNFNDDDYDDLAVSASGESSHGANDAGAVSILYGSLTGLSSAGAQYLHQNVSGVPGDNELSDLFGTSLAAGDFDGNGASDLAIGAPGEEASGQPTDAGQVTVLYGGESGALHSIEFRLAFPDRSEDSGPFVFSVERNGSGILAASARISVTGGTAEAGVDYQFTTTTLDWGIGDLADKAATLTIFPNTHDDGSRTVIFGIDQVSAGGRVGLNDVMTVTITDNDVGGLLAFPGATMFVSETAGSPTITVVRTGGSASAVTVDYAATAGTATAGEDFTPVSGTLTFGAGQSTRTFLLPILDDDLAEPTETVLLALSNPGGGGVLGPVSNATLGITDAGGDTTLFADGFEVGSLSSWSDVQP